MTNTSNIKLNSDFMLHKNEESGDFFLINIKSGSLFQLNNTSYDFLALCDGEYSYKQILEKLSTMYSVEQCILDADFLSLLNEWQDKEIITPID